MKRLIFKAWLMALASMVAFSCNGGDDDEQGKITFPDASPAKVVFTADKGDRQTLAFHSSMDWNARADVDWVTIAPMTGKSGDVSLALLTKETNATGEVRSGHLILSSGRKEWTVDLEQGWKDVINLEDTEYDFSTDGGELSFRFSTNVKGHFLLSGSTSGLGWIKPKKDANVVTKALGQYEYLLTVLPNTSHEERSAEFNILVVKEDDYNTVLLRSATITVRQKALPVDVSTDFSADKKVVRLQEHTKGNGFPVVLMGDGFADKDVASGYYDSVMNAAMENIFIEEPIRSLREYVDVWEVVAVSQNNAFGTQYSTCFGCTLDPQSSGIRGDENKVVQYVCQVPQLANEKALANALAIVILNTNVYAGVTGMAYDFGKGVTDFAMVFCPVVDGVGADRFRAVLTHEAVGHGIGKLYDEYAYEGSGAITVSAKNQCEKMQGYGWAQNVSLTSDPAKVPWADLLADSRYQAADAYGEKLGVYEGACTYWTGAWRPTDESMMHSNIHGFNAPSRREIYKRIMRVAMGDGWSLDYEAFVAFDQAHLPAPAAAGGVAGWVASSSASAAAGVAGPMAADASAGSMTVYFTDGAGLPCGGTVGSASAASSAAGFAARPDRPLPPPVLAFKRLNLR